MNHHKFTFLFVYYFIVKFCFCDVSFEKKERLLNSFVEYLKNLPDQPYILREGTLEKVVELDPNSYYIETQIKAEDSGSPSFRYIKCTGNLYERQDGVVEVGSNHQCYNDIQTSIINQFEDGVTDSIYPSTTEINHQPVQLDNEVQTEPLTSGEQFIAVPRESTPCIGCASQVNPEAAGVSELALLGVNQLNAFDPKVRHSLNKVISVERQVQVVNGVRFILTILVDYNGCSDTVTESCFVTKPCRISILNKPWIRLPDGSKYKTVVANNCTEAWLFDDDSRDKSHDSLNTTLDNRNVTNVDPVADIIKNIRNPEVQSQPEIERTLTDEDIKNIEQQIIPNNVNAQLEIQGQESNLRSNTPVSTTIPEDKKKAIDDLLSFYDYAGFSQNKYNTDNLRIRRSYENDLNFLNLAEKFNDMKKRFNNAKLIYMYAQFMVDYLNEMDSEIKHRILSHVLTAEEEVENNQLLFYIKALIVIPCEIEKCAIKDETLKVCNGIIDGTNQQNPQIITTFCYNHDANKVNIGKINDILVNDPILNKLALLATHKIERESTENNALKLLKIVSANTQKLSGILTKLLIIVGSTNCDKTKNLENRIQCNVMKELGSKVCDVEVLERIGTKKDHSISYSCSNRPIDDSFTNGKLTAGMDDPDVMEILQEALQYLDIQSDKNNKLKIAAVNTVTTQLVAGLLTNINFMVGYTLCRNDVYVDVSKCELIEYLPLRNCSVQVWHRPWLEDSRQINVSCTPAHIIKLSCEKLQIPGGLQEQDKNDPKYKALAEESLQKYLEASGSIGVHRITTIDKVTTQVVSGSLTRIDFTVSNSNSDEIRCHSEVWEQTWLKKKEINVKCNIVDKTNRDKRQLPGGLQEQDKNDPKYKALAEESLQKYLEASGSIGVHRITTIDKVTTQVVSGSLTRIDFTVSNSNSDEIRCHSEVWEQTWLNKKEINVTCNIVDKTNRDKRQLPGGLQEQDKNDPKYKALAEESLQKYLEASGSIGVHRITTIDKVTTQVVSGSLTRIDFTVSNSNSDEIRCHSEVWEQTWLNKKEINVTCNIVDKTNRDKRQLPGGLQEQDKNDPKYKALAEESLQKYLEASGSIGVHRITTLDKVTTQVVSGSLTRIDFTVSNSNSDEIRCHSEVWEQTWLNKKEINVTCNIVDKTNRDKRQLPGGLQEQDKNDPKYKALAEESLQKYLEASGSIGVHRITTIDKVTTQVVSGSLTRIDFTVSNSNSDEIRCHSEVWEQTWLKKKEINVKCNIVDKTNRDKRQLPGGLQEQDKNDPKYKALAEESLQKYLEASGSIGVHRITTIDKVTTQVVSGSLTRIDFTVSNSNSDEIRCHSEVWEQTWLNKKEINVTCNIVDKTNRDKRQLPGGLQEQDKNDPKYKALAEESLQKYLEASGSIGVHRITTIDKVTTQVVSGSLTRIDFTVSNSNSDEIRCHSEVWEQTWLNKKEINVTCNIVDKTNRDKRQLPGGLQEQDKNDPKYKALAEESLQKYLEASGSIGVHRITTIDKVTTQVVSGSLTRIDFTVSNSNSDEIRCHSEVWEQTWLKKKEINVKCNIVDKTNRDKRQLPGGLQEQDKNDPKYKALAEESLQKYLEASGSIGVHRITTLDKVTTQVVSGSLTRIDFTVSNSNSDEIRCHSEVWEQTWLNKKEINVTCNIVDKTNRDKRQLPGGLQEQDKNDPKYKALAEESLQKYLEASGSIGVHRITTLDKVTTQVVSGSLTRIDFTVSNSNSDDIRCHSEVWEQTWLKKKEINVKCNIVDKTNRNKRQLPGGLQEQDKNDPKYKALAEESLQKYLEASGSIGVHRITTIDKVTTQVVSGSLTRIDFTVSNSNSDEIRCHSEVWEQTWLNKKEIDVTCNIVDKTNRDKRQVPGGLQEQDKNDPKYKALAEESLQKYLEASGSIGVHRITTIDKVTTQVVSGSLTRIDFTVSNSNSDEIRCHSEVWEQTWLNKKEINVICKIVENKKRERRDISAGGVKQNTIIPTHPIYRDMDVNFYGKSNKGKRHVLNPTLTNIKKSRAHHKVGTIVEQDPTEHQYQLLAADSLLRHQQKLRNNTHRLKVLEVKKVLTQVVAGTIYKIDYTAVPTTCSMRVLDVSLCERVDESTILYCHTEIWNRPWLNRKKIDVSCVDNYDYDEDTEEVRSKRGLLGGVEIKNASKEEYRAMAEKALSKYEKSSKSENFHKIIKMNQVSVQVVEGLVTKIKFLISPTVCLRTEKYLSKNDCSLLKPITSLKCFAKITQPPLEAYDEDIYVSCRPNFVTNNKHNREDTHLHVRERRGTQLDENDIDEDTKFYYADRAVQYLNEHSNTDNLQKLITIHDVLSTVQMNTHMVRMYVETASTYCLRHDTESDLSDCDELDGTSHRLCLAKIFPSSDDELIILRMTVFCDDEPDFRKTTGLSIPDLLAVSLAHLEDSKNINYKLVHRGEPNVIPSLHSNIPVKLSFIVASTNCSKHVDNDVGDVLCFIDTTVPDKSCQSFIWMIPATKKILHVKANCSEPKQIRMIRSVTGQYAAEDIEEMLQQSIEKLEMGSLQRYKQKVLKVNSYSTKITSGKVTTIDFDVGYTDCLKHEWIDNITKCQFLEHLPRRHCVSEVWERLWLQNGRNILVNCQDDETPVDGHIDSESAETAMQLAQQALKHIEAKYPHPRKQEVVRIFSLEKQAIAGLHYRMKIEIGFTNCLALSAQENCQLINDGSLNRFCRVNVWIRPWTDHPPAYRVSCDYQSGTTSDLYHLVQSEQLFYNFLATYKPEYVNDHVEMTNRFEIFKDNVKKIHQLNTHEMGTATYAVTRFADLTYDEFSRKYLGVKPSLRDPNNIPMTDAKIPKVRLPESFDWRESGAVTAVKDQGSCGSCWAFSVTGNIEGQWKLKTGQLVSLSEQELVDCDKLDSGCDGGLMDNAYRAIEQLGGLEPEDDYPYAGEDDKCSFNRTLAKVQISGAVNITSNETDMAKWLVHNGPISIGINANAMQFYVGGVSHPWKMLCSPKNIDHGVLIVGYGVKDYPLFHKRLPYWIVKNSWGPSWGEQGYYRVYRGDGTCGVNTMASSAVV